MTFRYVLLVLIGFFSNAIMAQVPIGIGQWRDHLSYYHGTSVTQAGDKFYCVSEGGLFFFDKQNDALERESKISGLSDFGIKRVRYHKPTKTLVIAYQDANIDLIKGNSIINMADIKRSITIQGSKTINNIRFIGDFAYLCCNFGIVEVDLRRAIIRNTFFLVSGGNANVFDVAFDGTNIYAATDQGVFRADYNNPFLNFFISWQRMEEFTAQPYSAIYFYENGLYANRRVENIFGADTLYVLRDGVRTVFDQDNVFHSIEGGHGKLLISAESFVIIYNAANNSRDFIFSYDGNAAIPRNAVFQDDDPDYVWIADFKFGLVRTFRLFTSVPFTPDGPYYNDAFHINVEKDKILVSAGRYDEALSPAFNQNGYYVFENNRWRSKSFPNPANPAINFTDIVFGVVNPADATEVYLSSWENGLIEVRNNEFVGLYNETNSALLPIPQTTQVRVGGMAYDQDGNLWMTNSSSPTPLVVKKKDGTWQSYALGPGINNQKLRGLTIDRSGLIWIIIDNGGIALVKIEDFELQRFRRLTNLAGNGNLPSNTVNTIVQDLDGFVWVGTSSGVAVFYSPNSILDDNAGFNTDAQLIIVNQGGFNQFLLQAEEVTTAAVDGANRKWFGTSNGGLFLISSDGTQTVSHFTAENSPLFSNTILSLGLNQVTGELFVGTDKGILSYRGTATTNGNRFDNVYAFPNPVQKDYNGPITIRGLYDNSDVKITDVSGNVVFSTRATGGQAVWNGNRTSGGRAATGVYLVFGTNADGSQSVVTKILLLN
ncbi:MAG: two-component regulator propeller domain-containing protein [Flavobacteriales bacterium]